MGPQNLKYPLSARVFLFDLFLFVCLFCFFFVLFFQFKALLPGIVVFVPVPTRSLKLGTAWVFNNLQGRCKCFSCFSIMTNFNIYVYFGSFYNRCTYSSDRCGPCGQR